MCDSSFNCFTKNARDRKLAWAFQMALSGSYYIMDKARTQVLYYVKLTKFAKKHLLIDIFSAFQDPDKDSQINQVQISVSKHAVLPDLLYP